MGESEDYGSEVDSVMELKQQSKRGQKVRMDRSDRSDRSDYDDDTPGTRRGGDTRRPRASHRLDSEQSYRSHGSRASKMSVQTAIMNDEARKQIAMLEELAH